MRAVTFAAMQFACTWDRAANIAKAKKMVRAVAGHGANVVLTDNHPGLRVEIGFDKPNTG